VFACTHVAESAIHTNLAWCTLICVEIQEQANIFLLINCIDFEAPFPLTHLLWRCLTMGLFGFLFHNHLQCPRLHMCHIYALSDLGSGKAGSDFLCPFLFIDCQSINNRIVESMKGLLIRLILQSSDRATKRRIFGA
jgi:hypothetical protein